MFSILYDEIYNYIKPFVIEKPIVNNEKELIELRDMARAKGVSILVCHVLRYTPFYLKIKEIIASGGINCAPLKSSCTGGYR